MSDWHFTFVESNGACSPQHVWRHIVVTDTQHRSIAKSNGEVRYQAKADNAWIVLSPMGMWTSGDEYGESARRMSEAFKTRIIVMGGHTGIDAVIFGLFDRGVVVRALSACEGQWSEVTGSPQDWEHEILKGVPPTDKEVVFNDGSLKSIALHFGLPTPRIINPEYAIPWDIDEVISLSGPPPLPK